MTNRDVFARDPRGLNLLNNGVAKVGDLASSDAEERRTLRFELETFVCEGQYEAGLVRILEAYLAHLDRPEQPAVWVSGFYGSGKSHLVKVLRALWTDFGFPEDRATARGLAQLSTPVREALAELSTQGKKHGLHAASGTLGAAARGSVRLGLLAIVFRSAGLPPEYPKARFVLWLRSRGLLGPVQASLAAAGTTLEDELQDMYVSPPLARALLAADPTFAAGEAEARRLLAAQYPKRDDVSIDEMVEAVRKALTENRRFPCTLLALDEVQQQIGDGPEASDRSYQIQEVAEACSSRFGGKLMVVATGQSALTGTPLLQKLLGRFRVTVALHDADVEAVTRKMILAKRPDRRADLARVLDSGKGEIARHLRGTRLEPRSEDEAVLAADYPLLPVRLRFWERVLRAIDAAGTAAQLRSQLRIVLEAVQQAAERPLGHVIPADVLFDQKASEMQQTGVLIRDLYSTIAGQRDGTAEGELRSRLCALAFLISRLPREEGADLGVRANADTLADLLVEDLLAGSDGLRARVAEQLGRLGGAGVLMEVGGEYRLQTPESLAWNKDFEQRCNRLVNDSSWVVARISEQLGLACNEHLKELKRKAQGASKVPRAVELCFAAEAVQKVEGVPVWVRHAWGDTEAAVRGEARQAPPQSPTVFVFLRRAADQELRKALASRQAAQDTLDVRGVPTTAPGQEAQASIQTRLRQAEADLRQALNQILQGPLVLQAGGTTEPPGTTLLEKAQQAVDVSLSRLYPKFAEADDPRWENVLTRARNGDAAPLGALGWQDNTDKHPVCAALLAFIGAAGKTGKQVRERFEGKDYGWPRDAIDGALLALRAGGHIRASLQSRPADARQIERTKLNQYDFHAENVVLTVSQRLALAGLFQQAAGITCQAGEVAANVDRFLATLREAGRAAGGEPPAPPPPDLTPLDDLAALAGNAQLLAIHDRREQLKADAQAWQKRAEAIARRRPRWEALQRLARHAAGLPGAAGVLPQVEAIREQRLLLQDPDPVPPLCAALVQELRAALVAAHAGYQKTHQERMASLAAADAWGRLNQTQRDHLLSKHGLGGVAAVQTGTEGEVLASLERRQLDQWAALCDALPQRFHNALVEATQMLQPEAVVVKLPHTTIHDEAELAAWLEAVRGLVLRSLGEGPVIV